MKSLKEIAITEIENIKIGNAGDLKNATGCTVIICERGAITGVDIRGGGPASRETQLLSPTASNEGIHGLLLSGGSAFGLDAAAGVMEYLEQKNIGFKVGHINVPIVCASCLFDLQLVNSLVRPDKKMGYEACLNSENSNCPSGNVGAGIGATVGKFYGPSRMMKGGLGSYAVSLGGLKVGAIAAVNALGDVYDYTTGRKLAGLLNEQCNEFIDTEQELYKTQGSVHKAFTGNTTLGVVITNGKFSKTEMNKIAAMAQNGLARSIRPVHTSIDGDSVYAMSTGNVEANADLVGTLAATVMAEAIKQAIIKAEPIYGCKAFSDFYNRK